MSLIAKCTLICTHKTLVAEQLDPEEEEGDTTEGIYTQLRVCCPKLSCNFVTEIFITHNVAICIQDYPKWSFDPKPPAINIFMTQYVKLIQWENVGTAY